jgi:prenyltransferase beta subunit
MKLTCVIPVIALAISVAAESNGVAQSRKAGSSRSRSESVAESARKLMTPRTIATIDRGLRNLVRTQNDDGSFGRYGAYQHNVGVAALGGMALMASGSHPDRGAYGTQVTRAVDFILANARPDGFIISPGQNASHGPMYGHGFATLFLAEVYGSSPRDKDVRRALKNAVELIVKCQNDDGGWRYQPRQFEADISVTVCQIMALRAARNAGIAVPRETVDRCTKYVKRCQNPNGGFRYRLASRAESEFPRSAASIVALNTAGIYDGPEIQRALSYVNSFVPRGRGVRYPTHYYYYGHYYAAQAMWQAGGDHWMRWYPAIRDQLMASQEADGAWRDRNISDAYSSAMSLLILQLPNNYLPIFQR